MALNLTPIKAGKGSRTPLAEIDPEVSSTVEEAYEFCQADSQRLQTPEFASKEDAEDWLTEARAYAYQREAGRVIVAGNPATGTTKGTYVVRFRVETYVKPATDAA
jgi:hypothetical protein